MCAKPSTSLADEGSDKASKAIGQSGHEMKECIEQTSDMAFGWTARMILLYENVCSAILPAAVACWFMYVE